MNKIFTRAGVAALLLLTATAQHADAAMPGMTMSGGTGYANDNYPGWYPTYVGGISSGDTIHAHQQLGNIDMPGGLLADFITNKPEETSTDTRTGHQESARKSRVPLPAAAWLMEHSQQSTRPKMNTI